MDILFKTKKLAKCCLEERVMNKVMGTRGSRKLKARLADLRAASDILQVHRGRPHQLKGKFANCIAFDLDAGKRLVVEAAADPLPELPDGGLDWRRVVAIRVVFIGDFHG